MSYVNPNNNSSYSRFSPGDLVRTTFYSPEEGGMRKQGLSTEDWADTIGLVLKEKFMQHDRETWFLYEVLWGDLKVSIVHPTWLRKIK